MASRLPVRDSNVQATDELVWALKRAFGPISVDASEGEVGKRFKTAEQLRLLPRIAGRFNAASLSAELGKSRVEFLTSRLKQQVAQGLAIGEMERQIRQISRDAKLSAVLLKFGALARYGVVSVSTRAVSDLDILIDPEAVEPWVQSLEKIGYKRVEHWAAGHHPAVYQGPAGKNVELHVRLPYLRISRDAQSVTLAELRAAELLVSLGDDDPLVFLPRKDLLVANLVAHAFLQHGFAPAAYPIFRVLGDMVDLGLGDDEQLAKDAARWIAADESEPWMLGLQRLTRVCANGTVAELIGSGSLAERILSHMLGSALDPMYRRWLRVGRVKQIIAEVGLVELGAHTIRAVRRHARTLFSRF